jgi:Ankyrin repeats (3 copies)
VPTLGKHFKEHNEGVEESLVREWASSGRTGDAFGVAIGWGRFDLVEELLSTGIGPDERDSHGSTPLMHAALAGAIKVVKCLIKRGADVNAVGEWRGRTPLICCLCALQKKKACMAICRLLLEAGAAQSLHVRDADGRTAWDYATRDERPKELGALIEEHAKAAGVSLDAGGEVPPCEGNDDTVIAIPELKIQQRGGGVVATLGELEFSLPTPGDLKRLAIDGLRQSREARAEEAAALLQECDFTYGAGEGKCEIDQIIEVVITAPESTCRILNDWENPVAQCVSMALADESPALGGMRAVPRD